MRRALLFILLMTIVLRLIYSLGITRGLQHIQPEKESTDGYGIIAENLVHGQGYRFSSDQPPTTLRPPGYPAFLWLIFRIFGVNYVAVQVAQALLAAAGAWVLYAFGCWILEPRIGLWAAALFAFQTTAIQYAANINAENLYFPVFIGMAYLLCRAVAESSPRMGLFAGLLLGVGLLTRGTLLAFPPVLIGGLLLLPRARRSWRRWWRWLLPAAIGAVLTLSPWVIRNQRLTGSFVPVSTWGWAPFYHGILCSKQMLRWGDLRTVDLEAAERHSQVVADRLYGGDRSAAPVSARESLRHEAVARDLVTEEIKADPLGFLLRGAVGIPFTWFQTLGPRKRVLSLILHLPLMVLFVAGAIRMARHEPDAFSRAGPALVLVLFVNVFQAFVFPFARYMAPATALSFLWSAYALDTLWRKRPARV